MSEAMTQEDAMKMDNRQAAEILKPLRDMMIDQNGCPVSSAVFALDKAIEALSADVRENVRGYWKKRKDKPLQNWYQCSNCGAICGETPKYCSECGAEMRGEQE